MTQCPLYVMMTLTLKRSFKITYFENIQLCPMMSSSISYWKSSTTDCKNIKFLYIWRHSDVRKIRTSASPMASCVSVCLSVCLFVCLLALYSLQFLSNFPNYFFMWTLCSKEELKWFLKFKVKGQGQEKSWKIGKMPIFSMGRNFKKS